ncbi:MAG: hypothetical protein EA398_11030 [Deltaproteobacteria bacterium]|nr:MAG: hypothetical protein EA398_11030 [Deltaproteobacteria bacterium]
MRALLCAALCVLSGAHSDAWGADCDPGEVSSLEELVERVVGRSAAVDAERFLHRAAALEQEATGRERRPEWTAWVDADAGQRARPGDERAQGVSARGLASVEARWAAWDAARSSREAERALALTAAQWERDRVQWRVALEVEQRVLEWWVRGDAVVTVEALLAEVEAEGLEADRRVRAGLEDVGARVALLEEEERHRAWREAHLARRDAVAEELVRWADLCGRLQIEGLRGEPSAVGAARPEARWLELQAEVLDGRAESVRRADALRWDLLARAGVHASPAFEGGLQEEWIAGTLFTWRPDVRGVRDRRAEGVRQEAASLRARARLGEETLERQVALVDARLAALSERSAQRTERLRRLEEEERLLVRRVEAGLVSGSALLGQRSRERAARIEELEDALERRLLLHERGLLQGLLGRTPQEAP